MSTKLLLTVLLPLALGACMSRDPTISEDFGAAVRHNIALQTVTPDAGGPDDSQLLEGQKAAQAIESYREGPAEAETESIILNVGGGS